MGDWHNVSKASVSNASDRAEATSDPFYQFTSRRSPFLCRRACVASSQPLASSIGLELLYKGANAADVSVAVAAALAVLEPCSTGIGGDMFCLFYEKATSQVKAVNGSGKSAANLSVEKVLQDCGDGSGNIDSEAFKFSQHAVTVPGAARGWEDTIKRFGSGKFSLAQLLEPAAQLAEEGFPVSPVTAHHWKTGIPQIARWVDAGKPIPLTVDGTDAPKPGQIQKNPGMARVLRELGEKGSQEGFYGGTTGQAIVDAVQKHGGALTIDDLKQHQTLFPDPVCVDYRDVNLWQVPPNGQGIAALIAVRGLQTLEKAGLCTKLSKETIGTADAYHVEMEMMRLGFSDARNYVSSPDHSKVTNEWLLSEERIGNRAKELFDNSKAKVAGHPLPSSCTVSFQVVDTEGNAISFVNSNFIGFGSGIVPEGCGFPLQNRGYGFTLNDPAHPNALAPGKRPYHTIIPGMITYSDDDSLYATFTNMGGNMQPQGHLQLLVDMVAGGMDPQSAIDMPRFCIADGTQDGEVHMETGISEEVLVELEKRGHNNMRKNVSGHFRSVFGRAQIIKRDRETGILWAGSDGRADGCAMGF